MSKTLKWIIIGWLLFFHAMYYSRLLEHQLPLTFPRLASLIARSPSSE